MSKYIIALPVIGNPYLFKEFKAKSELEDLQSCVGGFIEACPTKVLSISDTTNARWAMAERLLRKAKGARVYYIDNSTNVPLNMNVRIDQTKRMALAPHPYGQLALCLTKTQLQGLGFNADDLLKDATTPSIPFTKAEDTSKCYIGLADWAVAEPPVVATNSAAATVATVVAPKKKLIRKKVVVAPST